MTKSVPGQSSELPALNEWLHQRWAETGLAPETCFPFELALEELFINVAMHGSTPGIVPQVEVEFTFDGSTAALTVRDDGPAFDPLAAPPPDVEAALEERPVGGLGIYLVREMMDDVTYQRTATQNCLRMAKQVA